MFYQPNTRRREGGIVLLEFAVVLSLIAALLSNTANYGWRMYEQSVAVGIAREAARFASLQSRHHRRAAQAHAYQLLENLLAEDENVREIYQVRASCDRSIGEFRIPSIKVSVEKRDTACFFNCREVSGRSTLKKEFSVTSVFRVASNSCN